MTLNQYAYDIWESTKGTLVDDDSIDLRQPKFWLNTQRALFLRNEYNKDNRSIDASVIQTLCTELEVTDASDCCEIRSGCSVMRTKTEIPIPIELHLGDLLTYVGPINNKTKARFLRINRNQAPWVNNGRFNKMIIHWFLHNRRIYLIFNNDNLEAKALEYLSVSGVFEDPESLHSYSFCGTGAPCYTDDMAYPLNAWMYDYIKAAILQLHVRAEQISPNDKANNAESDNQMMPK